MAAPPNLPTSHTDSADGIHGEPITAALVNDLATAANAIPASLALKAPLASPAFTGQVLAPDGTVAAPSFAFASQPTVGFQLLSSNGLYYNVASANRMFFGSATLQLQSTFGFGWTSGAPGNALDVALVRDAAAVLAIRNGTAAQEVRLYNTWTSAANYERLTIRAVAAADFVILPEAATGTLRGLVFGSSSGKLGFFGKTAVVQQTTAPTATILSDTITLVNALKLALTNLGLTT